MTSTFTYPFNTPTPLDVDVVSSVKQRCIDAEIEQRRRAKIVREEILDTLISDIDNADYIWNISDRDWTVHYHLTSPLHSAIINSWTHNPPTILTNNLLISWYQIMLITSCLIMMTMIHSTHHLMIIILI